MTDSQEMIDERQTLRELELSSHVPAEDADPYDDGLVYNSECACDFCSRTTEEIAENSIAAQQQWESERWEHEDGTR